MLIRVTPSELAKVISIWLTVVRQRRASLLRDLWTRTGEGIDAEKERHAQKELAAHIADKLERAGWEVMREEQVQDVIWRDVDEKQGQLRL